MMHSIRSVSIPTGTFAMGDAFAEGYPGDGETPVHAVTVRAFDIDETPVTNAAFHAFVEATGHRTTAERDGVGAVFHSAVRDEADQASVPGTPWWRAVEGACWRHPEGPGSDLSTRMDHPVVHVSWRDAQAYCAWAGRALPTEAQWEYAARGGLASRRFPWGDELPNAGGVWRCNIWQGDFPTHNTCEDGYATTAPVKSFVPNGFGLWQTAGNVWEWCGDWFDPLGYGDGSPRTEPTGPFLGSSRVMRGGSYLCHDSYCHRYRVAARTGNTPDSSSANLGFRTVSRPVGADQPGPTHRASESAASDVSTSAGSAPGSRCPCTPTLP